MRHVWTFRHAQNMQYTKFQMELCTRLLSNLETQALGKVVIPKLCKMTTSVTVQLHCEGLVIFTDGLLSHLVFICFTASVIYECACL